MKYFFRSCFLICWLFLSMSFGLKAQKQAATWKQIEELIQSQQPRSALKALKIIAQDPVLQNDPQSRLKAHLYACRIWLTLSPDSAQQALKTVEQQVASLHDPTLHCIGQAALLNLYYNATRFDLLMPPIQSRMRTLADSIFAHMPLLAATPVQQYAELFEVPHKTPYTDDVLSLLLRNFVLNDPTPYGAFQYGDYAPLFPLPVRISWLQRAETCFRQAQMPNAALLTHLALLELQYEDQPVRYFTQLQQTLLQYPNASAKVEVYIAIDQLFAQNEPQAPFTSAQRHHWLQQGIQSNAKMARVKWLKDAWQDFTAPYFHLHIDRNIVYPNDSIKVAVQAKNLKAQKINIMRFKGTAQQFIQKTWKERVTALQRYSAQPNLPFRFAPRQAYETYQDSLAFTLSEPGIYALQLPQEPQTVQWLYVTRLMPLIVKDGQNNIRLRAVDAHSGALVTGATLAQVRNNSNVASSYIAHRYTAQGDTVFTLPFETTSRYSSYLLYTKEDAFGPVFEIFNGYAPTPHTATVKAALFTDRNNYRPGQKLYAGATLYHTQGLRQQVLTKVNCQFTLYNNARDTIAAYQTTTDSFGVAAATLTLPTHLLPGNYWLSLNAPGRGIRQTQCVRIDNYRRPTFEIRLAHPTEAFQLGDSLQIKGTAQTLTQQPLSQAKVRYTLRTQTFARTYGNATQTGEVLTDSLGHFVLPLLLGKSSPGRAYAYFHLEVQVTGNGGETQTQQMSWTAGKERLQLLTDFPDIVSKAALPLLKPRALNSMQLPLKVSGELSIWKENHCVYRQLVTTEKAIPTAFLSTCPSGRYRLRLTVDNDILTQSFLLFSPHDVLPPAHENAFLYPATPTTTHDSIQISVGSAAAHAFLWIDLYTEKGKAEHHCLPVGDTLRTFTLRYLPQYGDGATAHLSMIHHGRLVSTTLSLRRPTPEKRLKYHWESFRSQVLPGQTETWKLQLLQPDGKPANASVMATLYDAALDAFSPHQWTYHPDLQLYLPQVHSSTYAANGLYLNYHWPVKKGKDNPQRYYTTWQPALFGYPLQLPYDQSGFYYYGYRSFQAPIAYASNAPLMMERAVKKVKTTATFQPNADAALENDTPEMPQQALPTLRTNFAETAFFFPTLRTDSSGQVSLQFTLPQSTTRWQFYAFAHTTQMDYALIQDTIVARKPFMVQVQMPRFIRENDVATLPLVVHNLTTEPLNGPLTLQIQDAQTGRLLQTKKMSFQVGPKASADYAYTFEAKDLPEVIEVIAKASTPTFTDGEAHFLPVISDVIPITQTLPFSQTTPGTLRLRIDTLFATPTATQRTFTIETCSNPTWYALTALPTLLQPSNQSSISWAQQVFGLTTAQILSQKYPALKTAAQAFREPQGWAAKLQQLPALKQLLMEETPWAQQTQSETERLRQIANFFTPHTLQPQLQSCLDRLQALQQPDGSFPWFEGMRPNLYVTLRVAALLENQSNTNERAQALVNKAYRYAEQEMHRLIQQRHANRVPYVLSDIDYDFVRLSLHLHQPLTDDLRFLLREMERTCPTDGVLEWARKTYLLQGYGRKNANTYRQRLLEHALATPQQGITFDAFTRAWTPPYRRMEAQCTAIEALAATHTASDTLQGLRLSLLLSQRTLLPQHPMLAADMLRALFSSTDTTKVKSLPAHTPYTYQLLRHGKRLVLPIDTADQHFPLPGYHCATYTSPTITQAQTIALHKTDTGLSWGAIYAQYTLPSTKVKAQGQGMQVSRHLEVWKNGSWIAPTLPLHVGDRIREVITLHADQDYDFVALQLARPAMAEPVRPLSGYQWENQCYRAVRDAATDFFFDHLTKGNHLFYEENFVTRPGTYHNAPVKVQCLYAPEFQASSKSQVLQVQP